MTLRPPKKNVNRSGQFPMKLRTESPFTLNYLMAAFGSEERSAHEQPPAASIQKVAIVHAHIIPYLRPYLK